MDDKKYIVRSGETELAGLRETGYSAPPADHKYILSGNTVKGSNTEAGFLVIEHLFGKKISRNKWYKDANLHDFNWYDHSGRVQTSAKLNYLTIARYIRENGQFSTKDFNLPDMECYWLDKSGDLSINFHKFDKGAKEAMTIADGTAAEQFGQLYPVKPQLDREGHIFTTLQPQLLKRIIGARAALIDNSHNSLHYEWVMDLRSVINDTITLVEITLNQIYIKAEFNPLKGWSFNKDVLGDKNGRRFNDKLKWVQQISGNSPNIESYRNSLFELKDLRNHLNHFDPPSLVITLEEATKWLNQIIDIGFILIKIRQAIGAEISTNLVNFILQKEAYFNPTQAFLERLPLNSAKSGYQSSVW